MEFCELRIGKIEKHAQFNEKHLFKPKFNVFILFIHPTINPSVQPAKQPTNQPTNCPFKLLNGYGMCILSKHISSFQRGILYALNAFACSWPRTLVPVCSKCTCTVLMFLLLLVLLLLLLCFQFARFIYSSKRLTKRNYLLLCLFLCRYCYIHSFI